MKVQLGCSENFTERHIGPDVEEKNDMLREIGVSDIDELIEKTVPTSIRLKKSLNLPAPLSEYDFLHAMKALAAKNKVYRSYIGMGYYGCITPPVILRNILENPGWYTAYTPYQAEIAQGRLEALLNFQTMVTDLTGMEIANASLLDEATAAAEAMSMLYHLRSAEKSDAHGFFVSELCHPQTIDVLTTRAEPLGIRIKVGSHLEISEKDDLFGVLLQYPGTEGSVYDYKPLITLLKEKSILTVVAADLLSLTMLVPPGELGADVAVGSSQRFGIPMGYGGPHAAFFATKDVYKRHIPGRIIGVSTDARGKRALRMALQTREQHIKRERATSNICTAQVLLAVSAGAYAVYHGAKGLRAIAERVHGHTVFLRDVLQTFGYRCLKESFFDTLHIDTTGKTEAIRKAAESKEINFRYFLDGSIGISLDETTSEQDLRDIVWVFLEAVGRQSISVDFPNEVVVEIPEILRRESGYLQHSVFNTHHSEHEMLRYLKKLENKDISLVHSMIPLGSCTMKLNATSEMLPLTWPEFSQLHPFIPQEQAAGYVELCEDLEKFLCEITGFDAVSLQPNSGAQGEYTGLMVIRAYHRSRGEAYRDVVLIPASAHGTNPASAVMAGMKVVVVKCDDRGNTDLDDLQMKASEHKERLAALMITYPSTHGVFEENIREICSIVHRFGGKVYMDGANMNAQVGLTNPATIGADVCHLNLHKTFCIPHGGGGPGMGPIGVTAELAPFLPGHFINGNSFNTVSAAPWGSASILTISYAYIVLMGGKGLEEATEAAILNANYLKAVLEKHYPVLYTGNQGTCAHEFILDCRAFKQSAGIEVEDIAKRLMDYGFHAPTVSFPVAGTLMIEPTESESLAELDRFCEAMIAIREEIRKIEQGLADRQNNVLKNAPHTFEAVCSDHWNMTYSREEAAFPLPWIREHKFWPSVSRIDNAYGDRNLVCTCPPVAEYEREFS